MIGLALVSFYKITGSGAWEGGTTEWDDELLPAF